MHGMREREREREREAKLGTRLRDGVLGLERYSDITFKDCENAKITVHKFKPYFSLKMIK